MNTISVSVDTNYQEIIDAAVLSGRYKDTDDVVCAGLSLLQERERRINVLRAAINEGIQSGFYKDFDLDGHLSYLENKYCNG